MAQRHPDSDTPVAGEVLAPYLREQATEFLRALRQHRESGADEAAEPAHALRAAARRISGALHTFRPLLDADWSDRLRTELAWLSGTLAREHAYAARLDRLIGALHRLSPSAGPRSSVPSQNGGLTVGAAKAGALIERQLTLARTRAHSTALQALGSSRFHAVADGAAVLASEVPLRKDAGGHPLAPFAADVEARLDEAVTALPLVRAGHPYNAEALLHGLAADAAPESQDAPWHQVRLLLRLHRYAQEATGARPDRDVRLISAGQSLDRHRDAAEAATAAASAARTPRIAPATAYALGVLHADQRHEVEASRFTFQAAWRRAPSPDHAVPTP
ncbi:CHAD domain-containing protein [Streptomyces boluensis]|uniref:CHAD domain-containing protein n=1 Tax=Streptomyces boluensis TaxID=1775135 RepID=A0A964UKR4_9ACTN|nr:CHAD domain-containing protein [Streptomyces boluensis]NBE50341.1 CHAD domain-containing protein [Streptomyces boluensis]